MDHDPPRITYSGSALETTFLLTEEENSPTSADGARLIILNSVQSGPFDKQKNKQWPKGPLWNWMRNAYAEVAFDDVSGLVITTSMRMRGYDMSYLTSVRSGWFDYAAEELGDKKLLSASFKIAGKIAKGFGLDDITLVGNAPVSTNVWTSAQTQMIPDLCDQLAGKHPDNFIGVRNLRADQNTELIDALKTKNFSAIPSRIVYEFDFRAGVEKHPSHLRRDRAALKRSGLKTHFLHSVSDEEAEKFQRLYHAIYIEKHSRLNAQYTSEFFQNMLSSNVMESIVLRDEEGQIVAFAMLYAVDDVLTVPALGYDPKSSIAGLYRMLFAAINSYAQEQKFLLNYSSGAGDFKRKRGGVPRLEHILIRAPRNLHGVKSHILRVMERQTSRIGVSDLIAWGA